MKFVAIDFETADYGPDSACAVGLVTVEDRKIVGRNSFLIRPPRENFYFTYLHGITWEDVKEAPTFGELWPQVKKVIRGADFLVAHNASFDKGVLDACCARYRLTPPAIPFQCTMRLARRLWSLYPTNLPAVCRHFDIPLNHHDAASDTEACARIMIHALQSM
jgi:DNA polymerase III subunit epsilon